MWAIPAVLSLGHGGVTTLPVFAFLLAALTLLLLVISTSDTKGNYKKVAPPFM